MGIKDFLTHFVGGTEYYYGYTRFNFAKDRIILDAAGLLFKCLILTNERGDSGDSKHRGGNQEVIKVFVYTRVGKKSQLVCCNKSCDFAQACTPLPAHCEKQIGAGGEDHKRLLVNTYCPECQKTMTQLRTRVKNDKKTKSGDG